MIKRFAGIRCAVALGTALALSVAGCGGGASHDSAKPGQPPAAAEAVLVRLASSDTALARGALSAPLASVLAGGRPIPPGSHLALDTSGWRQTGRFANATGTLALPGSGPQRIVVGFFDTDLGWKVTFLAQAT